MCRYGVQTDNAWQRVSILPGPSNLQRFSEFTWSHRGVGGPLGRDLHSIAAHAGRYLRAFESTYGYGNRLD